MPEAIVSATLASPLPPLDHPHEVQRRHDVQLFALVVSDQRRFRAALPASLFGARYDLLDSLEVLRQTLSPRVRLTLRRRRLLSLMPVLLRELSLRQSDRPVLLDNLLHLFRTSSSCHAASLSAVGSTDQDGFAGIRRTLAAECVHQKLKQEIAAEWHWDGYWSATEQEREVKAVFFGNGQAEGGTAASKRAGEELKKTGINAVFNESRAPLTSF